MDEERHAEALRLLHELRNPPWRRWACRGCGGRSSKGRSSSAGTAARRATGLRPDGHPAYGEPMVEFNQTGQTHASGGRLFLQGFGGDSSNSPSPPRQGPRRLLERALGDMPHGRALRALWDAEGVDHTLVRTDAHAFTAIYFVTHGEHGHEFHFVRRGSAASRVGPADVPQQALATAKLLHLSGISLAISENACDAGYAAIAAARRAGVRVSFDTNLR